MTRLLYVLGGLSVLLGALVLVALAARGEPLASLDAAGGAWGALGVGLAVLAIARSTAQARD